MEKEILVKSLYESYTHTLYYIVSSHAEEIKK